jgi:heme/copper-type cytochrome/quinol oxidase subunit 2
MNWLRTVLLPVEGSAYARQHDDLFIFIVLLTTFFFLLISGLAGYFVWRYRRRSPGEITPHITHNF